MLGRQHYTGGALPVHWQCTGSTRATHWQYTGSTNETQIQQPIYDYINITEQTAHRV